MSRKKRIGVLRGGPGDESEVSLGSGANILKTIADKLDDKYVGVDVIIDKDSRWTIDGSPVDPLGWHHYFDFAWNSLHGKYGEDGTIQRFMEIHHIPFSGSGSLGSALGMNKSVTKRIAKSYGITTPHWKECKSDLLKDNMKSILYEIFSGFSLPVVIKPSSSGSSVGVTVVSSKDQVEPALVNASKYADVILIEEYIQGTEATCGVIEGFRDEDMYSLPAVEIRPKNNFFDYESKYSGGSIEIVPGRFSNEEKAKIGYISKMIHKILHLRHYSRSDFIVNPKRGVVFLEVNTLPGTTDESLLPKSLRSVGSDLHEFVDHIISRAHPV